MNQNFSSRSLYILIATFILSCFSIQSFSQASKLKVIPEVQSFVAASGTYSLPANVSILVKTADTQLKTDSLSGIANLLKDELKTMFNTTATVSETTAETAVEGEILLEYGATSIQNIESYRMVIGDGIIIRGMTRRGAFWGTRTLLQLVENHANALPRGTIIDYPNFPSRGFMLDVGRKFFTIDFLRQYVKILSYYKMS